MIRQPTPYAALYAWHRAALRGERPGVQEGEPQCGWFRRRMVRGGPWVGARIWCRQIIDPETGELTEDETLHCEVAGQRRDPVDEFMWLANNPISEATFLEMEAQRLDPRNPLAATHVALDPSNLRTRPV